MPKSACCVPLCKSVIGDENKLSFFNIPRQKCLRKKWIAAVRRDEGPLFQIKINSSSVVCSLHFNSEDVVKTVNGRVRLKASTVPSIFQWSKTSSPRPLNRWQLNIRTAENTQKLHAIKEAKTDLNHEAEVPSSTAPPLQSLHPDHDYTERPDTHDMLVAAQQEIKCLQDQLESVQVYKFGICNFSKDSDLVKFYTGFASYEMFSSFFSWTHITAEKMIRWSQIQRSNHGEKYTPQPTFSSSPLSLMDQLFLFLVRVRQGFPENDLAVRFNISMTSVSRIIITWANYLYFLLGQVPIWPTRKLLPDTMPLCFRQTYPNVTIVLDCTEIKVQTPSSKVLNSELYSHYKSHTTLKGAIGVSPTGAVSFVSALFEGCISDKEITIKSGILDLLQAGDQVMADKGFLIQDLLREKGASLIIPPFLSQTKNMQFSRREVSQTQEIARLRIHVERAIRRVKEYHIFDSVLPLTLAGSINQLWTVCSVLTNFRGALF